jgi:hypothetical protein
MIESQPLDVQPTIMTTVQRNKVEMQQGLGSLCKDGW